MPSSRWQLRQSFVRHRLAPWLIALVYYHVSWLLLLVAPEWSDRLKADFEGHAEDEYVGWVARPAGGRDRESLLGGFLGEVEVAEEADQHGEDTPPLLPEDLLQNLHR